MPNFIEIGGVSRKFSKKLVHLTRNDPAVEHRTRNRESLGSNPVCWCIKVWEFSFSAQCPNLLRALYLNMKLLVVSCNRMKILFCIYIMCIIRNWKNIYNVNFLHMKLFTAYMKRTCYIYIFTIKVCILYHIDHETSAYCMRFVFRPVCLH